MDSDQVVQAEDHAGEAQVVAVRSLILHGQHRGTKTGQLRVELHPPGAGLPWDPPRVPPGPEDACALMEMEESM